MGMRAMQERVWQKRGEQYLLIKSPPASGKSRALMFVALDKLANQKLKQAIVVVPEKSIGASFHSEPLSQFGFWADWKVEPKWNLCDAPGTDNGGKVQAVKQFLESGDKALVCTHATFRFAVEKFGVEAFDDRLIAVDEFHHVSANPDSRLGDHVRQFMARDKAHLVAMTGSYFRGDAEAVLHPEDESKFDTVTYTYYEQLNGYQYLKQLDIGYYFCRQLRRRDSEGAEPDGEDDPAHTQREVAREHEGQDSRGGAHHRGTGGVARHRSRHRFSTGEGPRRTHPEDRRPGG
jgi:superfamily II DNA or RNA helicase